MPLAHDPKGRRNTNAGAASAGSPNRADDLPEKLALRRDRSQQEPVVQLYVRLQGTSVAQPMRALKGFRRVALAPAETKKVTFDLGPEAFAMWNDRNQFAVEPAKVSIWISPDSARGTAGAVEIVP